MDLNSRSEKTDLLGHSAVLNLSERFPFLGVPLEVQTNNHSVMAIARSAFSLWHKVALRFSSSRNQIIIKIIVHPSAQNYLEKPSFLYRLYDDCLLACGGGAIFTANRKDGSALAFVTPEALQNKPYFRRNVLDCLALFLATSHDRIPVHASVLISNHTALILAGPSGSGKSTLAYTLYRDGFKVLTEDAVYVSIANGLRLWGYPTTIDLLPDVKRFFPELNDLQETIQPNGKLKISIDLSKVANELDCAPVFEGKILLLLIERDDREDASLEPLGPEEGYRRLNAEIETGFDLSAGFKEAAKRLAENDTFVLKTGKNPSDSLEIIRQLVVAAGSS